MYLDVRHLKGVSKLELGWALVQYDWYPCKPGRDKGRKQLLKSKGKDPGEKASLDTLILYSIL